LFRFTTIKDYHNDLQNGRTTCVEAVLHYINTIKANQHLNAFLEVFEEEALARAAELDSQRNEFIQGKMHGVIVGIKDVICYKGHKVSAASKILENFTSIYNATVVERLLAEGAIIIGRQNCDEFAMGSSNENSAYGPVKNAADETKVPGGSSGGSAVAIQAGLCMVSLGSDTGGSVRQPADFCGVVGLKPSYGRISRYGLIAYASSFDQIGIFGNNIEDVGLTLEVIAGADEFDSTVSTDPVPAFSNLLKANDKTYRFAYFREAFENSSLDVEIRTQIEAFIKILTGEGNIVESVDFELLDYIVPVYYILTTAEASSNLSRYDGVRFGAGNSAHSAELSDMYSKTRSEGFGKEVKRRIMLGNFVLSSGYYDAYFTKAQQVRNLLLQQTNELFKHYDFIILPTSPTTAFSFNQHKDPVEMFLADIYTVFANLVGIPAISLPLFRHENNMPFSLQLLASHHSELSLLCVSQKLLHQKERDEHYERTTN
jgi:aspartyl-tRNA(Asn)/glutamyl-tRNA(Gln) amidotransferase subunit A